MTSAARPPLRILGLGNVLCTDDGLGVFAIERFRRRYVIPDDVSVLDGGTLGLSLIPQLEDATAAILVDAVRINASPGTLVRLEGDRVLPAVRQRLSVHQIGVADLLDALWLLDRTPPRLVLVGLVPESIDLGWGCTPTVDRNIDGLVERIAFEAGVLGWPLETRSFDEDDEAYRDRACSALSACL